MAGAGGLGAGGLLAGEGLSQLPARRSPDTRASENDAHTLAVRVSTNSARYRELAGTNQE